MKNLKPSTPRQLLDETYHDTESVHEFRLAQGRWYRLKTADWDWDGNRAKVEGDIVYLRRYGSAPRVAYPDLNKLGFIHYATSPKFKIDNQPYLIVMRGQPKPYPGEGMVYEPYLIPVKDPRRSLGSLKPDHVMLNIKGAEQPIIGIGIERVDDTTVNVPRVIHNSGKFRLETEVDGRPTYLWREEATTALLNKTI